MNFISSKNKKNNKTATAKKIPPVAAWKHYSKKQGAVNERVVRAKGENIVEVKDLTLSYEGSNVIENLSFNILSGDYLCVIGENGSGKSTLMHAILGLKKQTDGKIIFKSLKRTQIGVLPQQNPTQNDFPALVSEVVMSGCVNRSSRGPFLASGSKKLVFENLERLGITSLANRPFRDLSGGQKQRVLLARALCSAEKMLVLDEPVSGLDPKATADIYSLIADLNRKNGMTVLMVTHDIRAALCYSTKILRINKGSVFFGTTEEFKALPEAEAYIDRKDFPVDEPLYGDGGFRYGGN